MTWVVVIGAIVLLVVSAVAYLSWYFRWEARETKGMAYYGRPVAERQALKRRIRQVSTPARALVKLLAWGSRDRLRMPAFEYEGVYGPTSVSSPDVFARAKAYRPGPEDVFVVTQMRCGTTWMQQIVYQVVTRGRGDLNGGDGHLYAISPWIDAVNSVAMNDAPLVGDPPTRIIKSHLPTSLCPYSSEREVHLRHPASRQLLCQHRRLQSLAARSADAAGTDAGGLVLQRSHVLAAMAEARRRVVGVGADEAERPVRPLRGDEARLRRVLDRVAAFLGCVLIAGRAKARHRKVQLRIHEGARGRVRNGAADDVLGRGGEFLKSGKASRHDDVTPAIRTQILEYCRKSWTSAGALYKDLVSHS